MTTSDTVSNIEKATRVSKIFGLSVEDMTVMMMMGVEK
jgi:hypothetical protein